jgi:oligoendopeptidase F
MVLETFASFDPRLAELARRVFEQNHLDTEIRKSKDSGAFCEWVVPGTTPYILMSYQGRAEDVLTMAHELGHAVHSMLAEGHNVFTFGPCLPMTETASTFSELLLAERLIAQEADEGVRREILFKQLDGCWLNIVRAAYFGMFEIRAPDMIRNNASVDELCEVYFENLTDQFGDSVELSDEFRWEWVSIPHFYAVPFYVYAYAFGQLLSFSLYGQFKAASEPFKRKYLRVLSAGGSDAPEKILSEAGVDIRSEQFWQGGFDLVNQLVTNLEAISP